MIEKYHAFTAKGNGILRELKTNIQVRIAESVAKLRNIPIKYANAVAIWDTGATATSISTSLAKELILIPLSKVKVHTAGSTYNSNVYKIDILLPNRLIVFIRYKCY